MKKVKITLLAAGFMLALVFTYSCSGDDGNDSGNSFSYCLINGQCLDGPFTSKECGDLGGLPSNSCNGDRPLSSGGGSSSSVGGQGGVSSSSVGGGQSSSSSSSVGGQGGGSSSSGGGGGYTGSYGSVPHGGKTYKTVQIGTQTWFAENLNYAVEGSKCGNESSGKLTDNEADCTKYGRLYDWSTAMGFESSCNTSTCSNQIQSKHKGICPSGWHIPSDAEWTTLTDYVDSPTGTKLKSTSGWNSNGNGTDDFGFSALPGGYGGDSDGIFDGAGDGGSWWNASEMSSIFANYSIMGYGEYARWIHYGKSYLFSVRCLKDYSVIAESSSSNGAGMSSSSSSSFQGSSSVNFNNLPWRECYEISTKYGSSYSDGDGYVIYKTTSFVEDYPQCNLFFKNPYCSGFYDYLSCGKPNNTQDIANILIGGISMCLTIYGCDHW